MNPPSNGITAEVIRDIMPPYRLDPDLMAATVAALPPPPPDTGQAATPLHAPRPTPANGKTDFPGLNFIQSLASGAPAARPGGENVARPGGEPAATARPAAPSPTARLAPGPFRAPPPVRTSQPALPSGKTENPGRNALRRLPTSSLPPGLTRWGTCPGGERPVTPPLTRLTPTKAAALRSTTLAGSWNRDLAALLVARFGPPLPAPGWRIPRAMPATDRIAKVVRSFDPAPRRPAPPAAPQPATGRPSPGAPARRPDQLPQSSRR